MVLYKKAKKYQEFFSGDERGKFVLSDLSRLCRYNRPLYDAGGLDKDKMLFREGQRSVFLYIKNQLNMTEEQMEKYLKGGNNE